MRYLDTSLLVAALTNEKATGAAQRSLVGMPAGSLAVSDWVVTEFAAALAAKVRAGKLTAVDQAAAATGFDRLRQSALITLAVTASDLAHAARLAETPAVTLRAGDALHLAVATAAGATVCTLDKGLARAAHALDVPAVDVSGSS